MDNNSKKKAHFSALGICVTLLLVVVFFFTAAMNNLNATTSDLNEVQYLNASTQRAVRMVLMEKTDSQLLYMIGNATNIALDTKSSSHISVLKKAEYVPITQEILALWKNITDTINVANDGGDIDYDILQILLDSHFDSMTSLSTTINVEIDQYSNLVLKLQYTAFTIILGIVSLIILNVLHNQSTAKQNVELAKLAAIDTATGLFNRSKCQDLFKTTAKSSAKHFAAVIVIDLNDLKKTNDSLGHRVGDELIYSFAQVLKESCNIHEIKPFVGRYGGDEFVIYYKNISDENEIAVFAKELKFLTNEFNKEESRFQLSYAIGYEFNSSIKEELSVRQLFDLADENMYANKQAMKKAQAESEGNLNA